MVGIYEVFILLYILQECMYLTKTFISFCHLKINIVILLV